MIKNFLKSLSLFFMFVLFFYSVLLIGKNAYIRILSADHNLRLRILTDCCKKDGMLASFL